MKYDIIIVGAGPSGSILAHLLGTDGKNVLVIDKLREPKFRVWNGFLTRRAEKEICFPLYKEISNKQINTILFQINDKKFPIYFEERFGTTIDRAQFDLYLRERALNNKNITVIYDTVIDAKSGYESNKIILGSGKEIECNYLVGADGSHSIIGNKIFGYENIKDIHNLNYIATFDNVNLDENKYRNDTIHFQFGNKEESSLYKVIFPFNSHYIIREGLNHENKDINDMIKNLYTEYNEEELLIQTLIRGGNNGKNGHLNCILIGDAAGLLDPINGEGLYHNVISAKRAFQAFKEKFKNNKNIYLGEIYDGLMKDVYNEIKLKMMLVKDLTNQDVLKFIDEYFIRDYVDTITGKLSFKKFFLKYSIRKFPKEFIKSFFLH